MAKSQDISYILNAKYKYFNVISMIENDEILAYDKLVRSKKDVLNSIIGPEGTALHYAILLQNESFMEYIIKHNADIIIKNESGKCPFDLPLISTDFKERLLEILENNFMNALRKRDFQAADKIINNQRGILTRIRDGKTIFHIFAKNRSPDQLKYVLLKIGKDTDILNSLDDELRSPLFYAVMFSSQECVSLLISNGCDLNIQDETGNTALHFAVMNQNTNIAKLLLDAKCKTDIKNDEGKTALDLANDKSEEIADLIREKSGIDVSLDEKQAKIIEEITKNSTSRAIKLITNNKNLVCIKDKSSYTLLHRAAMNGNLEIMNALIDFGADVDAVTNKGTSVLMSAISKDMYAAFKLLVKRGANPNIADRNGNTVSHKAAQNENIKYYKIIKDCDPNVKNKNGVSPLDILIENKRYDIISMLRLVDIVDYGNQKFALKMIEKAKDVNSYDRMRNALHSAVSQNFETVVNKLIEKGADINLTDNNGKTAAMIALEKMNKTILKTLLSNPKLDITVKDDNEHTILWHLKKNKKSKLISFLLSRTKDTSNIRFTDIAHFEEGEEIDALIPEDYSFNKKSLLLLNNTVNIRQSSNVESKDIDPLIITIIMLALAKKENKCIQEVRISDNAKKCNENLEQFNKYNLIKGIRSVNISAEKKRRHIVFAEKSFDFNLIDPEGLNLLIIDSSDYLLNSKIKKLVNKVSETTPVITFIENKDEELHILKSIRRTTDYI